MKDALRIFGRGLLMAALMGFATLGIAYGAVCICEVLRELPCY